MWILTLSSISYREVNARNRLIFPTHPRELYIRLSVVGVPHIISLLVNLRIPDYDIHQSLNKTIK